MAFLFLEPNWSQIVLFGLQNGTILPSSLNDIGTRECYSYRNKIFKRHPYFANALANQITNEDGQTFSLLEIYKKSVSNPRIRKAELMTRIRGFEEVASQMGHTGEFYTLTSPSKMHAVLSSSKSNPKFNGATPKEVNDYFNNNWKLIRSALQKKNIPLMVLEL